MKCKVSLLKESVWEVKQWDGASSLPDALDKNDSANTFCTEVDAESQREAYSQAYFNKFGYFPPVEKVNNLLDFYIVNGHVSFFLDDDLFPTPGSFGQPEPSPARQR
jgi:hypothetical protein